MTLADQIKAAQEKLLSSKDALVAVTKSMETSDDESLVVQLEELSSRVEAESKSVDSLLRAEAALASKSAPAAPAVVQAKHLGSKGNADLFFKAVAAVAEAHVKRVPVSQVVNDRFNGDEATAMVVKSATAPAMSNVSGWAAELARETYGAFMDTLKPESVIPQLPMQSFSFDGFNSIKIPSRLPTPNVAGAFRAEGAPIPVKQMGFGSRTLTPKSMGVISAFTNEIFERSTPNILDLIRSAIIADTAISLDTKFLSADAEVAGIAPAGIQNGIAAGDTAVSSGNTASAIVADLRARMQSMYGQNLGKRPVWVMNPARALGLSTCINSVGTKVFPEMANGVLMGAPFVTSTTVAADVVYLIDAGEVSFAGGLPRFVGTDVATLHYEDTTPAHINGATAATPVQSLYQTNSAAIRCTWELDWAVMRSGAVQTITGCDW
jgi:HK97 family phage major capsid protein